MDSSASHQWISDGTSLDAANDRMTEQPNVNEMLKSILDTLNNE